VFLCYNKSSQEIETLPNTEDGKQPDRSVEQSRTPPVRTIWGISYIKGKLYEYKTKRDQRKAERNNENAVDRAARRTADSTVWIARFTVVLAIASIITLYEVWAGGADTAKLAQAAVDQATALEGQEQRMETLATAGTAQALAATEAANAAKSAADTAAIALKQSQKTFLAEQRPYVWVDRFETQSHTIGQPLTVNVYFVNYGKTPATSASFFAHVDSGAAVEKLCDGYRRKVALGTSIIGAGKADIWKTAISVEDANAAQSKPKPWDGKMPIAVYGKIAYTDFLSSGITYESDFCVEMLGGVTPLFVPDKNTMH
jgi:hypothetical protein